MTSPLFLLLFSFCSVCMGTCSLMVMFFSQCSVGSQAKINTDSKQCCQTNAPARWGLLNTADDHFLCQLEPRLLSFQLCVLHTHAHTHARRQHARTHGNRHTLTHYSPTCLYVSTGDFPMCPRVYVFVTRTLALTLTLTF